jgi:hypothetical protein
MSLDNFIITVYCFVDDILKTVLNGEKLRQRGILPKLEDAEVITMEIVGEFLGIDTDKGIWCYFHQHWLKWFPELGSRTNFVKQASNLCMVKQKIQRVIAEQLGAFSDTLHMADGFPIPVCKFRRANFSSVFKGKASYGFCASKGETYYGFKGNIMINSEGVVANITVTAANIDERESLWDITDKVTGLVIADKGLIGADYQKEQKNAGIDLQTPKRSNMADKRGKNFNRWLVSTRRLVETVIGQFAAQFHIEKVWARDLWHLTNRIMRKVLAHTIGIIVNKIVGNPPLQFERILT